MARAKQTQSPEAPARTTAGPFGVAQVIDHGRSKAGVGIKPEAMLAKEMPEVPGAAERQAKEKEKAEGMKKAFGIGAGVRVLGASPNSPQSSVRQFIQ